MAAVADLVGPIGELSLFDNRRARAHGWASVGGCGLVDLDIRAIAVVVDQDRFVRSWIEEDQPSNQAHEGDCEKGE
jgi:hypothetical protein